jgi:hypothetical protein
VISVVQGLGNTFVPFAICLTMIPLSSNFTVKTVEFAEWVVVKIFSIVKFANAVSQIKSKEIINVQKMLSVQNAPSVFKTNTTPLNNHYFSNVVIPCTKHASETYLSTNINVLSASSLSVTCGYMIGS